MDGFRGEVALQGVLTDGILGIQLSAVSRRLKLPRVCVDLKCRQGLWKLQHRNKEEIVYLILTLTCAECKDEVWPNKKWVWPMLTEHGGRKSPVHTQTCTHTCTHTHTHTHTHTLGWTGTPIYRRAKVPNEMPHSVIDIGRYNVCFNHSIALEFIYVFASAHT